MDDARPKMCFSPSPPSPIPKAIFSSNLTFGYKCSSEYLSARNTDYHCQDYNSNNIILSKEKDNMQRPEDIKNVNDSKIEEAETTSDYKQWLHAMKLVARLPGGIPPEFRRKLWLSLADKYLKSKNVDWAKAEEKCFCEKWREDDEELGIQIVKDLHRTGSTLCTGPAGDLNQAKLKRILLGYARYNPEVGYCQGFNMLGALILQVMDKDESASIKVMIYLVEGILPTGYFCGSMGGLQADMAVFRELMQTKLPRLAKHLQKLQGPIENAYEPPLTNVFTMQWFLTMFCTCLPMSCVLRIWDLVLIEGSDVLLRTALALWSLLEERVLSARSADDFYGKMGSFSSELLNGHLIDSNGLIEKVVQLGPIVDIQKLRSKHLYNNAPLERQQGLQLYFDDDEPDIDEDSRLAVATVWGIPWGRRGSQGQTNSIAKQTIENKDRIALDISLLRKQYDKLRERQKQAQIILTTACSTASRQSTAIAPLPVNQLLSGRPAIVMNKGRRSGPPSGAIPPARKPSLPAVLHDKPLDVQLRRGETLHWRDTNDTRNRRDSLSWKEIKAERAAMITSGSIDGLKSQKLRTGRLGKSDSSSYSEESDDNEPKGAEENASSTDTSLCDDDLQPIANDKKRHAHVENNLKSSSKKSKKTTLKQRNQSLANFKDIREKIRPKSWAPSNTDIPFVLMTTDSPNNSADENNEQINRKTNDNNILNDEKDFLAAEDQTHLNQIENSKLKSTIFSHLSSDDKHFDRLETTSTIENVEFLDTTTASLGDGHEKDDKIKLYNISDEGVTNEYFERVNSTERPTKLDLLYSLNEDETVRDVFKIDGDKLVQSIEDSRLHANDKGVSNSKNIRCMDLLVDYSEKSSVACIEEAKTEISAFKSVNSSAPITPKREYSGFAIENLLRKPKTSAEKRRDPRRLTLTRSSTMDIEKRFEVLEKRLSMEVCSNYNRLSEELEASTDGSKTEHISYNAKINKPSDKKIPSTADLEERFKNIQQQLVRDRNKMIKSPCDSENNEKQPNLSTSSDKNLKKSSQNNESNKQAKKPNDSKDNTKTEGEQLTDAHLDSEEKPLPSEEVGGVNKANNTKDDPSTPLHTPKSSTTEFIPSQSKKEPPDENINEKDIVERNERKSTVDEVEIKKNKKADVTEEPKDNSEKNIGKPSPETVEQKEVSEQNRLDSKRSSDRISPPSTEELEKRFCVLEEQMGPGKIDSNETRHCVDSEDTEAKTSGQQPKVSKSDTSQAEADILSNIRSAEPKTSLTKFEQRSENNTKRRLSEPPSTEDLEKRYEVLKRRMSSRNFETRTVDLHQPNKSAIGKSTAYLNKSDSSSKHSPPSIENLEERYEKLQNKNESKSAITTHSPPSTENLEERFEKLQNKNEANNAANVKSPPSTENLEKRFEKLQQSENDQFETNKSMHDTTEISPTTEKKDQDQTNQNDSVLKPDKSDKVQDENSLDNEEISIDLTTDNVKASEDDKGEASKVSGTNEEVTKAQEEVESVTEKKKTVNVLSRNANKIKIKLIEELQAKIKDHAAGTDIDGGIKKKTALIEELKTKIDSRLDKNLKPTQISSRRQPPSQSTLLPSLSLNDETLESHATSAYCRSGKYEPTNSAKRKMVRRFSDLPSRADLENRLQFLEEQLSKALCMQRRSSDSEVASKARSKPKAALATVPLSRSLEYRVQELEKRLNDNSTFSMDVEKDDADMEISQVDSVAATGKELVRYSSHGEVGDAEHQNPINISINIQMTLNKDDIGRKKSTDVVKTDDLDRRLHFLEQQLKTTQELDGSEMAADKSKESPKSTQREINLCQTEKTDEIEFEKNNDEIENNCDIKNLDKTPQHQTEKTIQLKNEDVETSTSSQSNRDVKNSDDMQNQNSSTASKQTEKDLLVDDHLKKVNDSRQSIETEKQIESTKSVEPKTIDQPQKDTNSENQPTLMETNNVVENRNKEQKRVDQIKSADILSTANTPTESTQNSLKRDKCSLNSSQHKTQPQDEEISDAQEHCNLQSNEKTDDQAVVELKKQANLQPNEKTDGQEMLQLGEHTSLQSNKTTEAKECELNEQENIKICNNDETKTNLAIEQFIGSKDCSQIVPVEVNKKTLVLLLDNEPKAVKVRRLTRANTEELEDLFQALEKQLNDRGHQKNCEKDTKNSSNEMCQNEIEMCQAMSDLTKEIEEFSKSKPTKTEQNDKNTQTKTKKEQEEFDWGNDPIKYHLKKKTVYLPSTKELEARFRSLERQIKLLEDVEKIDVEQRLTEIERKIKLQYSLSHEKDLNKFLELCEGKDPDDLSMSLESQQEGRDNCSKVQLDKKCNNKHTSPNRLKEALPSGSSRYSSPELKQSKSKQSLRKQPIHPLEMLLDPSPDDIPTTGELEHRIRVMEESRYTPSPPSRKSRSVSPPTKQTKTKPHTHILEQMTASPEERNLPTAEELEARLEALEREQCFNFKMQKNFQQFNQKLKDVVSPSLSFDEFKSPSKSCDMEHTKTQACSAPKQTTSPKTIRFYEEPKSLSKKDFEYTKTAPEDRGSQKPPTVHEGLGVAGIRLMRETSPLRRKGTHTGVPLRTGENINDQLTSIQNTIKSIDSLCEEKPYRKEKCQQYIDSLFTDSLHFAHKKASLEDLTSRNLSRSTSREIGPSIRISDHSPAFPRSTGSADSIQSSSPLRSSSPLQYRSNRDLRREPSPRRRRDEDREEHESRVRRDNLLPNINYNSHSILSNTSHSSLTKFHKVDSQLIPNDVEHEHDESLRHPTLSTIDNLIYHDNTNTSKDVNTTPQNTLSAELTTPNLLKIQNLNRPTLPLCQNISPNPNTPVYTPAKLEIRHTTVTSTFYDRVLTEKQLEKQHLHSFSTNNPSPMISPLFEGPKTNLPTTNSQVTNKTFTYRYDKYVDSN